MGQYESVRVGASVELSFDEASVNLDEVYKTAEGLLNDSMRGEIEEAISLLPAGSSSHVLSWGDFNAA